MREIRTSGSEGGGTLIGSPYPYLFCFPIRLNWRAILRCAQNDMLEGFRHHL